MSTVIPVSCGYWSLIASAMRHPPLSDLTARSCCSGVILRTSVGELNLLRAMSGYVPFRRRSAASLAVGRPAPPPCRSRVHVIGDPFPAGSADVVESSSSPLTSKPLLAVVVGRLAGDVDAVELAVELDERADDRAQLVGV